MDENLEEFQRFILDTIGYYDNEVDRAFGALIGNIKNQLLRGDYKSRTGNLRRSIEVFYKEVDGKDIINISMKDYGYFISFGVNGSKRRLGIPINEAVANGDFILNYRPGHIFGSLARPIKVPGIRPRKFYPLDIEEQIIKILLPD